MPASAQSRSFVSPYLLLTVTTLLWAVNWVLARGIRADVGPNVMALGRWLVAAVVILPFAARHLPRDWPVVRSRAAVLLFLGVTGAGAYNALSYAGVAHTTAINAMLLNAAVPFFILALSWALLGERLSAPQAGGLLVACGGALWIIVAGEPARLVSLDLNRGDLLVCLAMLSWAVYTVVLRRNPVDIHVTSFVAVLSLIAIATLLPLAAWEWQVRPPHFGTGALAGIAYLGVGPSVLCYLFWSAGVAALGPNRTGLFLYLVPVFGSVISTLFLGERPELYHAVGFALVLAGLALSNRRAP